MLDETGEQAAAVGDDPFAQGTWMALAYIIFIGGIVGFGLWFWLIARCTMARVAPFALREADPTLSGGGVQPQLRRWRARESAAGIRSILAEHRH
jgi:hypothetical protein